MPGWNQKEGELEKASSSIFEAWLSITKVSTAKTIRHLLHRFLCTYRKSHALGLTIDFANQ